MATTEASDRWRFVAADGRIAVGPCPPARVVVAGGPPTAGVAVERADEPTDDGTLVRARARNDGDEPVALDRLVLFEGPLRVGEDRRRWRAYRNGYQSWSGTRTIGADERDRDLPTAFGRAGATDARHRAPRARGHVRSDAFGVVAEPVSGDALGVAFTTLADAFAFVEVEAAADPHPRVSAWVDLDGATLGPGESTPWFTARVVARTGDPGAGNRALRALAGATGDAMAARGRDRPHPTGWCSWYFYFTDVTESDVRANLAVLAADGRDGPTFGCEYVMVDDGHQAAIGDWLTTNEKFPSGMAALAGDIEAAGFDAGIWWAPFLVSSRSRVAADHPEWLVRDGRGRPILGLLNPGWGLATPMRVLDTTRPDVLEHLAEVARTIGADWGYAIQKLDFLYAAALPGVRHDARATRAQALRRGLEAIRSGAGEDAFLLGCGCPLGPAVGVVDAMRIGADVTPSWTSLLGRTAGRNRHGLATSHAILNTLTRSGLDGAWFLNDPDCLMVRDTDTRLTIDEVRLLATAFAMTDGMLVLSDDLAALSAERRALVARARALAGGRAEVVDLFERALPELVVSRHPDGRVDVGLLNLGDGPRPGTVDLARLGLADGRAAGGDGLTEYWTGRPVELRGTLADVGVLPRHSARVIRLEA
ncbi:MAG: alpha-galactosidase [Acidimicrobiales bacterium]|nr:alpha-galactosidase [Acidimicrobiales bacterium]MCB9373014.1 alpha-galactosidase [Microthrixaceae bacterium]